MSAVGPFLGPRPFEAADRHLFFGRDREAYEVSSLLLANRLFILYAMSGAGKTSLVNAGVLALVDDELEVLPTARFVVRNPDADDAANVYSHAVLSCWADSGDLPGLRQTTLTQFLAARPRVVQAMGEPKPRLLVFDQFEELFTAHPERWQDRAGFLAQLAEATEADPSLRVLVVLREDFLSRMLAFADAFLGGLKDRYFLEPLRKPAAHLAITGPVRSEGRSFEPGAVDDLVRRLITSRVDLGNSRIVQVEGEFIEPVLLQVVCQKLWAELPQEIPVITAADIRDVGTSLADFYSDAVRRTAELGQVPERQIREWVGQNLLTHPGGTRGTVHVGARTTAGLPNQAVELLVGTLLRQEFRAGARWLEITHDSLLGPIEQSNLAYFRAEGPLSRQADALALAEAQRWQLILAARRLNDPAPLQISWTAADPALMDSWEKVARPESGADWIPPAGVWVGQPGDLAGCGNVAELVDRLPGRRLVLLGEPGSGKTVLLARLVLELLARRATGDPVPVIVSAATWDPVTQDLHSWLADQLAASFADRIAAGPPDADVIAAGPALIAAGLVLPVLDDLDEMTPDIRRLAVSRINDALRAGDFLVAACRADEYQQMARSSDGPQVTVRSAAAVHLDRLATDEVDRYLRACAGSVAAAWEPVLACLGTSTPVGQALTSPLMVGLARARYSPSRSGESLERPDPGELCDARFDRPGSVEELLLGSFVATARSVLRVDPQAGHGPTWKTERWLGFLARRLERAGGDHGGSDRGIAWWQLASATTRYVLGLVIGLTVGLLAAAACAAAIAGGQIGKIEVAAGLVLGLVLAVGLAGNRRPVTGIAPADLASASPRGVLGRARRSSLIAAVSYGIPAGLGAGLAAGLGFGARPGLTAALLAAIMVGLVSAAYHSAWLGWQLTRTWLAINGSLPWRPMAFLAEAHALGILRQQGPCYQFRYANLQRSYIDARGGQASRPGSWERLRAPAVAVVALFVLVVSSFAASEHLTNSRAIPTPTPTQTATPPGSTSASNAPTPDAEFRTRNRRSAQIASFSPDGRYLAVGDAGGAINLWNLATHRLAASLAAGRSGVIGSIAFSPDGKTLAASDSHGEIYLWNVASDRLMSTFSCAADSGIGAFGTPITDVAFSPDGKLFAVTVNSKTAVMCSSNREIHGFFTLPDVGRKSTAITAVAINQDATALAIGSSSGRAYVFDIPNAAKPHLVSALNPSGLISSIAFSATGDKLALASSDGFTFLFDLTSLRQVGAPIADPGRSRGINSVTFSPDGKLLAAADGNGSTYVSSISTGKLLAILPDLASRGVAAVGFSPDGSQLATANVSGVTYLWPLSSQSRHPTPPKSASSPSAIVEATAINTLLMSSVQTRSQFDSDTLTNDVASCLNVDSAVTQIGDIAAGRASELTQAMDLKVDSIPDGALLKSKLIAALGVSLKIDKDYLAWAKQQASTGCAEGINSVLYQLAVQLDEQATNVKTEFLNLWNPEAAQFGLVQFSRGQI